MIGMIRINTYVLLMLQIIVGIAFYIGISAILKLESFKYILEIIKNTVKNKKVNE